MTTLTIENFWKKVLPVQRPDNKKLIQGWHSGETGLATFKEAPLSLSADLSSNENPEECEILLISAPGAVGKSTLAKQIAFATGAVYVDLAKADPVGGNTISGGLVKSDLFKSWQEQKITLLIDGLDEARLRVTQEAFEAFLSDIAELSKSRNAPLVLFGRTGAVQDAWLILEYKGAKRAVLEIGYYGPEDSIAFAEARVRALKSDSSHASVERAAIKILLSKLRAQTQGDGDRFAGYAPVLQAVADRVAKEENPAALIAQIESGGQPVTLQTVVSAILERERNKLAPLPFEDTTLPSKLYRQDEQLDRLIAKHYGLPPPAFIQMGAKDVKTYSTALQTWVEDHPFLDGDKGISSAVFEAVIIVRALKNKASSDSAVSRELKRGAAANPFVAEFYFPEGEAQSPYYLPPAHIGVVYSSLRARLSIGDTANLLVDAPEDEHDEAALTAQVEITLSRSDIERPRVLNFDTEQTSVLRLGTYVEDVEIFAPLSRIEIGPGSEALLVAPVSIQCDEMIISAEKVIAECPPSLSQASVFLEANNVNSQNMSAVPTLRGKISLRVSWPGAQAHPWTSFATLPTPIENPKLDEALGRFRKFVIAFRSHSKGSLRRYKHKLDHARMTKGAGQAVLNSLIEHKILSLTGNMYTLNPDLLGEITGATYADSMARRFSNKTVEFVTRAIDG